MQVIKSISVNDRLVLCGLASFGFILAFISFVLWRNELIHALWTSLVYLYLLPLAYIDKKLQIIPNKYLPVGFALAGLYVCIHSKGELITLSSDLVNAFAGLAFGAGLFALASVLSKGGVGAGDIKMFGLLGFMLGFRLTFGMVFFSLLCSALTGVFLLVLRKAGSRTRIPAAPFALAGTALMILSGG